MFETLTLYAIQSENVISSETAKSVRESYKAYLNDELVKSDDYKPEARMLQQQWAGLVWPASQEAVRNPETGVYRETLVKVGKASVNVPEGFVSILKIDSAGRFQ